MEKSIWIDASKEPDPGVRKKLILTALESGFGHIVVSKEDTHSNRYGRFHMIVTDDGRLVLDGEEIATAIKISGKQDERRALELAKRHRIVVIEASDWKVIPLENLIVGFSRSESKLFVRAHSVEEAKLFLETMEKGADGIVLTTSNPSDIVRMAKIMDRRLPTLELTDGKIKRIRQLGLGDRVCVDTCSMLKIGEGMLVGSSSSGLFLIHGETHESEYVASRPFRINAGAVHAYTLLPDGGTKYLSELESGDEVLIVDPSGGSRVAVVGRLKIERRPLLLIEALVDDALYSTIVQNAETIRLVSEKGALSVTDLKPGDIVKVRTEAGGRHFGSTVNETIQEK